MAPKRKRGNNSSATTNNASSTKNSSSSKKAANSGQKSINDRNASSNNDANNLMKVRALHEIIQQFSSSEYASRGRRRYLKSDYEVAMPLVVGICHRLMSELHAKIHTSCDDFATTTKKKDKQAVEDKRLVRNLRMSQRISVVLAAFVECASKYLASADRYTLDKVCEVSVPSIVNNSNVGTEEGSKVVSSETKNYELFGRAIVNLTSAATGALTSLVHCIAATKRVQKDQKIYKNFEDEKCILNLDSQEHLLSQQALWSALSALERMVQLGNHGTTTSSSYVSSTSCQANSNDSILGGMAYQNELISSCTWSSKSWLKTVDAVETLFRDDELLSIRRSLDSLKTLKVEERSNPVTTITVGFVPEWAVQCSSGSGNQLLSISNDQKKIDDLSDSFSAGLFLPITSSAPIRRWGAMTFVWLCRGQPRLIDISSTVLKCDIFLSIFHRHGKLPVSSDVVPANVVKITFASRIVDVVCGSNNCIRSSWQTKESFVKRQFLLRSSTNGNTNMLPVSGTSAKPSVMTRREILTPSLRMIQHLITTHIACINETCPEDHLVNGGTCDDFPSKTSDKVESLGKFYPWLHCTITTLSKIVGASFNISSHERTNHTFRFTALAAAIYVKKISFEKGTALDARMLSFITSKLAGIMSRLNGYSKDAKYSIKELDLHLPIESSEFALNSNLKTFGGVFPSGLRSSAPCCDALALFLRAMIPTDTAHEPSTHSPKVKRRRVTKLSTEIDSANFASLLMKRLGQIVESCFSRNLQHCLFQLKESQINVAADLMDFLKNCLVKETTSVSPLLPCFRAGVDVSLIDQIIKLSQLFNDNILSNRVSITKHILDEEEKENLESQGMERLWLAHMELCSTVVCGHPTRDGNNSSSVLDSRLRLHLYKEVAKVCTASMDAISLIGGEGTSSWPLHLPAVFHSLVSTNISSEAVPTLKKEILPEKIIVDGTLVNIRRVVSTIAGVDVLPNEKEVHFLRHALQINEARLFVLALCRLTSKELERSLLKIIDLCKFLQKKLADLKPKFLHLKYFSSFIARIITIIGASIEVSSGDVMARVEKISSILGSNNYNLPSPYGVSTFSDDEPSSWYKREDCYMGIFDDWEHASTRHLQGEGKCDEKSKISLDDLDSVRDLYTTCIKVGFISASRDHCHLLFAAWNMSGKLHIDSNLSGWTFHKQEDHVKKMLVLRDEMCSLHYMLNPSSIVPGALLPTPKSNSQVSISCLLKHGLTAAFDVIEGLIEELPDMEEHNNEDRREEAFACVEFLLVFVSFIISHYTKSNDNCYDFLYEGYPKSKCRGKSRGISDDTFESAVTGNASTDASDVYSDEDDEEDEDARIDAFSNFHDICCELGVAPTHPDFLDVTCYFVEGISSEDASEAAKIALDFLARSTTVVLQKFESTLVHALDNGVDRTSDFRSAEAVHFCFSKLNNACLSSKKYSLGNLVCQICSISDHDKINSLIDDQSTFDEDYHAVREAWVPNAVHRLRGKLHEYSAIIEGWEPSNVEMRAAGDWEMMLSDCLIGSSIKDFDIKSPNESGSLFLKGVAVASHWKRLTKAFVGSMTLSSALMRFALEDGNGRDIVYKDLCKHVNQPKARVYTGFGPLSPLIKGKNLSEIILNTVKILNKICCHGISYEDTDSTCKMAIRYLMDSHEDALTLEKLSRFSILYKVLDRLDDISQTSTQEALEGVKNFAEIIVKEIDNFLELEYDYKDVKDTSNICSPAAILQTFFSSPKITPALGFGSNIQDPLSKIIDCDEKSKVARFLIEKSIGCGFRYTDESRCILLKYILGILEEKNNASLSILQHSLRDVNVVEGVRDIISLEEIGQYSSLLASRLTWFFYFMTEVEDLSQNNSACENLQITLLESLEKWICAESSQKLETMELLTFIAFKLGSLEKVGNALLSVNFKNNMFYHQTLELFFCSVVSFAREAPTEDDVEISCADAGKQENSRVGSLDLCSFVATRGDFTEQHWYNCYTCGLIKDKGCCTLCAQICHANHDVSYSRKSSFFCDCGSETSSWTHKHIIPSRPACKCLQSRSTVDIKDSRKDKSDIMPLILNGQRFTMRMKCVRKKVFRMVHIQESLSSVIDSAKNDRWLNKLIVVFKSLVSFCYESLKVPAASKKVARALAKRTLPSQSGNKDFDLTAFKSFSSVVDRRFLVETASKPLVAGNGIARNGDVLHLQNMATPMLFPMRAAKIGTFKINSTDERIRLGLNTKFINMNCMCINSRGCAIIIESSTLLFCSLLPILNLRHSDNAKASRALDRSQMCVLGEQKLKFQATGMSFCQTNDHLLVLWDASNASVVLLSGTKIDMCIDLTIDLEPSECETEYLLKCMWIGQSHVLCVCGTCIKAFDIRKASPARGSLKDFCLTSCTCYSLAYEDVLVRAAVLVDPFAEDDLNAMKSVQLVLLLDNGRLHSTMIGVDEGSGDLNDVGDIYIEVGDGIQFPSGGIRRYSGATPCSAGAKSSSLGEGSGLFYCPKSKLLLYKCTSSPLIAMKINAKGCITSAFELLPHSIKAEDIDGSTGYAQTLHGPYTNWSELRVCYNDTHPTYTMSCVARAGNNNRPTLLLLDVSNLSVSIKPMSWPDSGSNNYSVSNGSGSVGGLALFSVPVMIHGNDDGKFGKHGTMVERIVVALLNSNGSLQLFGEQIQQEDPIRDVVLKPCFPLEIFETLDLLNLNDIVLSGDVFLSDVNSGSKEKLSIDRPSDYIVSASCGGTVAVSIKQITGNACTEEKAQTEGCDRAKQGLPNEGSKKAIVGIRLLLGRCGTDFPRNLTVMGRLVRNICDERWHDIPLTEEEIIIGIRAGFVCVTLGRPSNDGDSFVIQAMEVYTRNRSDIDFLPRAFVGNLFGENVNEVMKIKNGNENKALNSISKALTFFCHLLNEKISEDLLEKSVLLNFIEATSVNKMTAYCEDRQISLKLLEKVQLDCCARQYVIDEGTMKGVTRLLLEINTFTLRNKENSRFDEHLNAPVLIGICSILSECLKLLIEIVSRRPRNYEEILCDMHLKDSLVVKVSAILGSVSSYLKEMPENSFTMSQLRDEPQKFVPINPIDTSRSKVNTLLLQLCLNELYLNVKGDVSEMSSPPIRPPLAKFEMISELLIFGDEALVDQCCSLLTKGPKDDHSSAISLTNVADESDSQDLSQPMTYRCDGCHALPIRGMRYTLEQYDIDLCASCYDDGSKYASSCKEHPDAPVYIKGHTLLMSNGDNIKIRHLQQMKEASIANSLEAMDFDEKNCASVVENDSSAIQLEQLSDYMYKQLLAILARLTFFQLEEGKSSAPICGVKGLNNVFSIIAHLICEGKSQSDDLYRKREAQFAQLFTQKLSSLVKIARDEGTNSQNNLSIILVLKWLSSCVDNFRVKSSRNDPAYICRHGLPAVRRKCSQGINKDRRFYVCSMDVKDRCEYFRWAKDGKDTGPNPATNIYAKKSSEFVELRKFFTEAECGEESLEYLFCIILSKILKTQGEDSKTPSASKVSLQTPNTSPFISSLKKTQDSLSFVNDLYDGVFISKAKLDDHQLHNLYKQKNTCEIEIEGNSDASLILHSLILFSSIAPNSLQKKQKKGRAPVSIWNRGWFNFLCSVISTSAYVSQRLQAKRMLKRLCGGQKSIYHQVRDNHIFSIQYRALLDISRPLLMEAFFVIEKARMCGRRWKDQPTTWAKVTSGDFLGVEWLISEDCLNLQMVEKLTRCLDELIETTKSRSSNWRKFCASSMSIASISGDSEMPSSPLTVLFWLLCSSTGRIQRKVLELVDIALPGLDEKSCLPEDDMLSSDSGYQRQSLSSLVQENSLVESRNYFFSAQHVIFFILQFVLHGSSMDARNVGKRVASKLVRALPQEDVYQILLHCVGTPLNEIGSLGDSSAEFFELIQDMIREHGAKSAISLESIAKTVFSACHMQLKAISCHFKGTSVSDYSADKEKTVELRFDLSRCIQCSRYNEVEKIKYCVQLDTLSVERKKVVHSLKSNENISSWAHNQLRPFTKFRLEAVADKIISSEFANYCKLKSRFALSDLHINVQEPRGRFVKSVEIYFSPRQVNDVSELKEDNYIPLWQKCGTLWLGRGMTKGSCKLALPTVAANLKFEYSEFYPGGANIKTDDGAMILTCPRCARVVNNVAGVCGHCGEVAFQCRKCRHINYDRLDAFLCVECGFCASGIFSFEIMAGIASSASSIENDEDYERAGKLFRLTSKRVSEARSSLRKKLSGLLTSRRKRRSDYFMEEPAICTNYSSALRRCLQGEPPKTGSKAVSKKRKSPDNQGDLRLTAARKARSLLNLAQQLRGENSNRGGDRNTRNDLLLRQAFLNATGGSLDFFEEDISGVDDGDIFGMLGGVGGSVNDLPGSSISRIVASLQTRNLDDTEDIDSNVDQAASHKYNKDRDETSLNHSESNKLSSKKSVSNKEVVSECSRFHESMREADRECFELEKAITAWERLNRDSLSEARSKKSSYSPSFCSKCGIPVALQIMMLVLCIVRVDESFGGAISQDLIATLFSRYSPINMDCNKELDKLKQILLIAMAERSEVAADLIVKELRQKLKVFPDDAVSANILGSLVEKGPSACKCHNKFVKLATSVLSGNL